MLGMPAPSPACGRALESGASEYLQSAVWVSISVSAVGIWERGEFSFLRSSDVSHMPRQQGHLPAVSVTSQGKEAKAGPDPQARPLP